MERLEDYFVCSNDLVTEGRKEFADAVGIVENVVQDIREGFYICLGTGENSQAQCFVERFLVIRDRAAEYMETVRANREDIIERSLGLLYSYVQCRLIPWE